MVGTATIYKGNDATITITAEAQSLSHTVLAISDFSINMDKGTVEQELVGETGNYFIAGSLGIDGSLTSCKIITTAVGYIVSEMIGGNAIAISGACGANSLNFYFVSAQVTGFDFTIGDADTITEGSIDFSLLKPYLVSALGYNGEGETLITDQPLGDGSIGTTRP